MSNSRTHYEQLLAPIYSWMVGGFDAGLERNARFFERHGQTPRGSGRALDLGAGCGFQSISLARQGYDVTAIDIDGQLLRELEENAGELPITTLEADLRRFPEHIQEGVEIAVCMVDTLLHLESVEEVQRLFVDVWQILEDGGSFILTFRDLTEPLTGVARFIPVRSDDNAILTCFLEYAPDAVVIHDLLYRRQDGEWHFSGSCYRKLRLSGDVVIDFLVAVGFAITKREDDKGGMTTLIAQKN